MQPAEKKAEAEKKLKKRLKKRATGISLCGGEVYRVVIRSGYGNETITQYFKSGKLDFLREFLADGIFQEDLLRQDYDYLFTYSFTF